MLKALNRMGGASSSSRWLPLAALCLLLGGCGKDAEDPSASRSYDDLSSSLEDARKEAAELLGPDGGLRRTAWDSTEGSAAWTETATAELGRSRRALESARDIDDFCPGYAGSSPFQKETCWLRILTAMARFESHFRPQATYRESNGRTSVGLLMMNPEHCPGADNVALLQKPLANIRCAVSRMSRLVARASYLSGPGNAGAASYWSVLRDPYRKGSLMLGRKPHIQVFTRSYRAYREP